MRLKSSFSRPDESVASVARLPAVDVARGAAVLAMILYHFCWDINDLQIVSLSLLTHPGWLLARTLILSGFLVLVGVGLVLAQKRESKAPWWGGRPFGQRLGRLVLAAAAVSAASFVLYPHSPIIFGVLHHIAVASLLGRLWLRGPSLWHHPLLLVGLALVALALPHLVQGGIFDHPALLILGLASYEPVANDFVPLFPWLGVVLCGMAAAHVLPFVLIHHSAAETTCGPPRGAFSRLLAWGGRHSLAIYLLHQPLLFGALTALVLATGIGVSPLAPRGPLAATQQNRDLFIQSCRQECVRNGGDVDRCTTTCTCLAAEPPELFTNDPHHDLTETSTPADPRRFAAIARCLLPSAPDAAYSEDRK